jgi:hypothetical protein
MIGSIAIFEACRGEDRRWARVVVAWSKSVGVGSCLQEFHNEHQQFPASLSELKAISTASGNSRCSREPELLSGTSFDFVSFRFHYKQKGGGSDFVLTAKPLYEGPHQCTFWLDKAFVLEQTCEDSFWGSSTARTRIVAGAPVDL